MIVKLYTGGILGSDAQVLSSLQSGSIDFTTMNSGILQTLVKEFAVVDFPFLFNDSREVDAIMDGPVGKQLADKLPEKGLVSLAYYDLGFRNLTNSKRPIKKLEDLQGLSIRVIQSPTYIDTFNALGAKAVPLPFSEVYAALEQKKIDGQENPFSVIASNKLDSVQKYLTVTRHIYNPQSFLMSRKTWDRLNKEEQEILVAARGRGVGRITSASISRDAQERSLASIRTSMEVPRIAARGNQPDPGETQAHDREIQRQHRSGVREVRLRGSSRSCANKLRGGFSIRKPRAARIPPRGASARCGPRRFPWSRCPSAG